MHPGTLGVNHKVIRESKINKTLPKSKKVGFKVSSYAPYESREGKFILHTRLDLDKLCFLQTISKTVSSR